MHIVSNLVQQSAYYRAYSVCLLMEKSSSLRRKANVSAIFYPYHKNHINVAELFKD